MLKTTVIIVNWNGRSWLQQCLPPLAAQTVKNFDILVVDNGSTDDSIMWLARNWPDIIVLPLEKNLGFAAANNIGIRATDSPLVALLNNDTLVDEGWLEALVTAVSPPQTGMVASQIVRWNQPHLLDSAGIQVDRAGIAWNRGWGQPIELAAAPCPVFGPSGAAALYRRDMLDEIGLFDEDYFAYYEDVDLAWRAQRAGWTCHYAPDARVRHWHSATANKTPHYKNFLNGRNKLWTIMKNYDWPALFWAAPIIIAYDVMATVYQTVNSRNLSPLRGRWQAVRAAKQMINKRQPARQKAPFSPLPFPGKQPPVAT
ncbi:MAG: glycosyltransferase family 2 protein [Chloroflexi bacterium]|nr:MAG: glycosyltransferase family 2 protein [Chloroflexota bacterium]